MKQTKVFFATFFISFSIMLCCYMALYWIIGFSSPKTAGENARGIPLLTPDYNDSKTTLLIMRCNNADFFFLLKLNALQNKASLVSIPSDFHLSSAERTLAESMAYAGPMQCVQDLSRQFDITIDYHLLCDKSSMSSLLSSFSSLKISSLEGIPQSVSSYLLKGSEYMDTTTLLGAVDMAAAVLDNPVGLEFLNLVGLKLMENNMSNICDYALEDIKTVFTSIDTNIGTKDIDRLRRICTFLLNNSTQFERTVLADSATAQQEIDRMFKE